MPAPFQLIFDFGLSDLNPIDVGEGAPPPNYTIKPTSFNGTIIHHVRSGYGTLFIKDRAFPVKPGQAFIIHPGQEQFVHYTSDKNHPWTYAWISFTGRLAPHFALLPPVFDLPKGSFPNTYGLKSATGPVAHLVAADLFAIYGRLVVPLLTQPDLGKDIAQYLQAHYMQKLAVADIAAHFGLAQRDLCRCFKDSVGISIRAYLTQLRMEQAECLLKQSRSVKEIVEACGFGSVSNFYQQFASRHHMTPLQWLDLHEQEPSRS